ncbi:MAG: hypothetical protein ACRD1S_13265 [Vicinamibacterales bacterium]
MNSHRFRYRIGPLVATIALLIMELTVMACALATVFLADVSDWLGKATVVG